MNNAQLVNLFKESTKNYSSNWGSSALIGEWLDEGQIDIILRTRCYTDTKTIPSVASQREYSLGTDVLGLILVMFNNAQVEEATIEQLMLYNNYPSETAGTPTHFYLAQSANPTIGFSPHPSTGSLNIAVRYLKRPPSLVSSSTDPVIPEQYHRLIVEHAMYRVLIKDAKMETATKWLAEYERRVDRMAAEMRGFNRQKRKSFTPYGEEHKVKSMKAFTGDV